MLHGCAEVKIFFYLEFKARSKEVRNTAGKGYAHPHSATTTTTTPISAVLLSFFNSSHQESVVQTDKIHVLYLDSSGLRGNTMRESVALVCCSDF